MGLWLTNWSNIGPKIMAVSLPWVHNSLSAAILLPDWDTVNGLLGTPREGLPEVGRWGRGSGTAREAVAARRRAGVRGVAPVPRGRLRSAGAASPVGRPGARLGAGSQGWAALRR